MRVAVSLEAFVACALTACSPRPAAPPPPVVPPTPKTVTVANPGGDASDPEWAALDRLSREPWSLRRDRTASLVFPLPDARNWTRVRIWMEPTRVAFRFGDDHYGVFAVWYAPTTESDSPDACLARFIADARPRAEGLGAHVLEMHTIHTLQHAPRRGEEPRPMVIQVIDARVDGIFSPRDYAGALAASPSFPHTCLIQGFVVPSRKHPELARRVRDRWVTEGAPRLTWHSRLKEAPPADDL